MTAIIKPPIQAGGNLVKTGSTISDGPALATDAELTAAVAAHALTPHASAPADASTAVKGITKLSTAPAVAANPIAAGDNDPRLSDARPPTGGAGGVLSDNYPNPGFAVNMAEQSELQAEIDRATAQENLKLDKASNLSDLANAATALANLGGATPADVTAAVAAVIDSSPAALDTLNELAAALGDDPNFATTLTNALAGKQPLDSDLTAIAALTTTAFGRGVLELADAAAARALTGAVAKAGDTSTGLQRVERAAAANQALSTRVAGDANDRWAVQADGTMLFGPGSAALVRGLAFPPGSYTALGESAGLANSATDLVAVGRNALKANTTGIQNVAVGTDALLVNTTGLGNVAIGTDALKANTTGQFNMALGFAALGLNTTANYNVAMGTAALGANTTGTQNTGVGFSALRFATTGNYNTAIGVSTLYYLTTGTENTAIGRTALTSPNGVASANATTTGVRNTAVGSETGQASATQRNDITVIGYRALADGNNATAIGSGASAGAAGAVAIGKDSGGTSATTTVQDEIKLGTALHTVNILGKLRLAASVAGGASHRIPHGVAPTSPVDGDIWTTTAGLFVRVNGVTVGPLS